MFHIGDFSFELTRRSCQKCGDTVVGFINSTNRKEASASLLDFTTKKFGLYITRYNDRQSISCGAFLSLRNKVEMFTKAQENRSDFFMSNIYNYFNSITNWTPIEASYEPHKYALAICLMAFVSNPENIWRMHRCQECGVFFFSKTSRMTKFCTMEGKQCRNKYNNRETAKKKQEKKAENEHKSGDSII